MRLEIRKGAGTLTAGALALLLALPSTYVWAAEKSGDRCSALASFQIDEGRIVSAKHVAAPFVVPASMGPDAVEAVATRLSAGMAAEMAHGTVKVPFCRVVAVLTPTSSSEINVEVWLPEREFNGRLVQEGDGGILGAIPFTLMSKLLNRGYAVAGSDKGHNNANAPMEWRWGVDQPEKVIDQHYRATHVTSVASKALVAKFYGAPAHRTYFSGCSGGAVQGYEAAMHNPDDFDGVAIGGAAPPVNLHKPSGIADLPRILAESKGLDSAKLEVVSRAAIAACDKLDGVADGVVSHPRQCEFDPAVLACSANSAPRCLTDLEVTAVKQGYATGMYPGTEYYWRFAEKLGAVFPPEAYKVLAMPVPSDQEFLQGFAAHGHKMIAYIGTVDVSAPGFERYQEALVARNLQAGSSPSEAEEKVATFYRAFELPGMEHCMGGPGANNISASLQPERPKLGPDQDIMAALASWVEQGKSPNFLVATKYTDDDPAKAALMTRRLCVYPEVAVWDKKGDSANYRSFACANPPR